MRLCWVNTLICDWLAAAVIIKSFAEVAPPAEEQDQRGCSSGTKHPRHSLYALMQSDNSPASTSYPLASNFLPFAQVSTAPLSRRTASMCGAWSTSASRRTATSASTCWWVWARRDSAVCVSIWTGVTGNGLFEWSRHWPKWSINRPWKCHTSS